LKEALELTAAYGQPGKVGVNLDLLHLERSGGGLADIASIPAGTPLYAQVCDGAEAGPMDGWDYEASSQRLYPGEGRFDVAGFIAALPTTTRASIEIPRDDLLAAGVTVDDRAARALAATRAVIAA
jgi:sugar phosphate isomerase/epimerase